MKVLLVALLAFPLCAADRLRVEKTDRVGRRIENAHFVADLSKRMVRDREEDAGTLRALTFKQFGVTFLRTQNRMHWAPSLQRTGATAYQGIGTWDPVQTFREEEKNGVYTHWREGYINQYPEVRIEAEYRFLAGVPYFLFRSVMIVEKPISMHLLRNQEMTMDAFFDHVAWPGPGGKTVVTEFSGVEAILGKAKLPADVPWICFMNYQKGYGYGAVVLHYSATKSASPVTSINFGANNGKYWDRRIVNYVDTQLASGDRFEERTAYLLFRTTEKDPLKDFLRWEKKIRKAHR